MSQSTYISPSNAQVSYGSGGATIESSNLLQNQLYHHTVVGATRKSYNAGKKSKLTQVESNFVFL